MNCYLVEGAVISQYYVTDRSNCEKVSNLVMADSEEEAEYKFIKYYEENKLLVIINLTDVEYKIPSPYELKELINTEALAYQGSGNINGSINKNDFIKIRPFGSAIFKIKEDK